MNTLAPPYWPTWIRDPENPDYAKPDLPNVLVPQTHEHIGDKLSKKNVDWAWYAGAWQATLDQFKDSGGIPKIPNFQYHHQPFNYFKNKAPRTAPNVTNACATVVWVMSRAPTGSSPTPKPASCPP